MKILERYITGQITRNLAIALFAFTSLYIVFDFFDRIDNILAGGGTVFTTIQYFVYKIPPAIQLMLPVAMLVSTLFTLGMLSKNSEITAMRASGIPVLRLARPVFIVGLSLSIFSIVLNETLVPYFTRRTKEIYNIDIRQKDKKGGYSQNDFWWRSGNDFFAVGMFDSRQNTLHELSKITISDDFSITKRIDAQRVRWMDPIVKWSMEDVVDYRFTPSAPPRVSLYRSLPLTINETPESFYDIKTDPDTMSYLELKRFMRRQAKNGLPVEMYRADLYQKFAFPFVNLVLGLIVVPFALKPARSGSLAVSFIAGLVIGFSYYAVNSFSIALGRAEVWPPFLAAWTANLLMGVIGAVLLSGAESPQ